MRYYYVYKIESLLDGSYYIGVHSTKNLDDGYFGSGVRIKRAVNKHGRENFKFTILEFLPSREEMFERERELIDEKTLSDPHCLNLKCGGSGGWDFVNRMLTPSERKARGRLGHEKFQLMRTDPEVDRLWRERMSDVVSKRFENTEFRERHAEFMRSQQHKGCLAALSNAAKLKRKNTLREISHQQEHRNSQYGTMWIYNPETSISKKIKKDEGIPFPWVKGRRMNVK